VARGLRAALQDLRSGVDFIRNQPLILSSMVLDFFATFFASANTLLPYFSQFVLHVNEVAYGWLASAASVGAVTVGLVISQFGRIRRRHAHRQVWSLAYHHPLDLQAGVLPPWCWAVRPTRSHHHPEHKSEYADPDQAEVG
jgi:hypothetical protein